MPANIDDNRFRTLSWSIESFPFLATPCRVGNYGTKLSGESALAMNHADVR